jgi:hypothetical protein
MLGFKPVEFTEFYAGHDLNLTRIPNGAMHPSEGCNPGKGWEGGCVLKERRIRMDLRAIGISSIGGVPSERVDVSGVVPKVPPWAGTRRPVGAREPYRLAALRCHGASNKSKAAETVALPIGRRRPWVHLIFHGLRNPKRVSPCFPKSSGGLRSGYRVSCRSR